MPQPKKPIETIRYQKDGSVWFMTKAGAYHREDGPAFKTDTSEVWYINGQKHRDDAPAEICADGSQYWYQRGKLHREDGPAYITAEGDKLYYLNNVHYPELNFNRYLCEKRGKDALIVMEKFTDKYHGSSKNKEAAEALFNFLSGSCPHAFRKNEICELCQCKIETATSTKGT